MKNPFANLFKKKDSGTENAPATPEAPNNSKKENFLTKLLKKKIREIGSRRGNCRC